MGVAAVPPSKSCREVYGGVVSDCSRVDGAGDRRCARSDGRGQRLGIGPVTIVDDRPT